MELHRRSTDDHSLKQSLMVPTVHLLAAYERGNHQRRLTMQNFHHAQLRVQLVRWEVVRDDRVERVAYVHYR